MNYYITMHGVYTADQFAITTGLPVLWYEKNIKETEVKTLLKKRGFDIADYVNDCDEFDGEQAIKDIVGGTCQYDLIFN